MRRPTNPHRWCVCVCGTSCLCMSARVWLCVWGSDSCLFFPFLFVCVCQSGVRLLEVLSIHFNGFSRHRCRFLLAACTADRKGPAAFIWQDPAQIGHWCTIISSNVETGELLMIGGASREEDFSHQQFFVCGSCRLFKGQLVPCGSHRRHESLVLRPREDAFASGRGE